MLNVKKKSHSPEVNDFREKYDKKLFHFKSIFTGKISCIS